MTARKLIAFLLVGAIAPAAYARDGGKGEGKGNQGNQSNKSSQRASVPRSSNKTSNRAPRSGNVVRVNQGGVPRYTTAYTSKGNKQVRVENPNYNKGRGNTNVSYGRTDYNRKVRPTAVKHNNNGHRNDNTVVVYNNKHGRNYYHGHSHTTKEVYYTNGGYYRRPYYYGGYGGYYGNYYRPYFGWGWPLLGAATYAAVSYNDYDDDDDRDYRNAPPIEVTVQQELARRGFYKGEIDGIVGPGTRQAIADYQYSAGLSPTGRIDDTLLRSLGI